MRKIWQVGVTAFALVGAAACDGGSSCDTSTVPTGDFTLRAETGGGCGVMSGGPASVRLEGGDVIVGLAGENGLSAYSTPMTIDPTACLATEDGTIDTDGTERQVYLLWSGANPQVAFRAAGGGSECLFTLDP